MFLAFVIKLSIRQAQKSIKSAFRKMRGVEGGREERKGDGRGEGEGAGRNDVCFSYFIKLTSVGINR